MFHKFGRQECLPYCAVLAALTAFAISVAGSNPFLPGGGDNAAYIAEAESLLTTGQRRQLYTPGAPAESLKPPLFPLLLAGVETLTGRNLVAMKILLALFAAGAVLQVGQTFLSAQSVDPSGSHSATGADRNVCPAFIAFWFALAPSLTLYTHDILADVPFTLLVLLALGLATRAAKPDATARTFIPLAIVLVLANLLRSAGILACLACAGYFCVEAVLRRREPAFRQLLTGSVLLLFLTAGAYAFIKMGQQSYLSSDILTRASEGNAESKLASIYRVAQAYALFIPAEIAGYEGFGPAWAAPLLILLGVGMGLAGSVRMLKRGERLIPLGFLLLQGPLLLYPYLDARFYLPSLPLFICLFWTGCQASLDWAAEKGSLATLAVAFLIALAPAVSTVGTLRFAGAEVVETASQLEWGAGAGLCAATLAIAFLKWKRAGVSVCIAILFLACAGSRTICENVLRERHRQAAPSGTGWPEFYEAAQTIKAHSRNDETVLSAKPSLVWFWTGLRGYTVQALAKPEQQRSQLEKAQWVILDELVEDRAIDCVKPLLAAEQEQWEVVYRKNNTVVIKRK